MEFPMSPNCEEEFTPDGIGRCDHVTFSADIILPTRGRSEVGADYVLRRTLDFMDVPWTWDILTKEVNQT
jgi:hypothetical protein